MNNHKKSDIQHPAHLPESKPINQIDNQSHRKYHAKARTHADDFVHRYLVVIGMHYESVEQIHCRSPHHSRKSEFCDNRVLNGVLNSKRSAAENGGIEFQVKAAVPEKLCVDGVDLCALIGNGLDNAIEACMKCPEGGRYVNGAIKAEKGILAVKIENSAAEGVHLVDGNLPATTKKASQGHGFSLRSMKEIAQRYGGKLELSLSDDGKKAVLLVWLSLTE